VKHARDEVAPPPTRSYRSPVSRRRSFAAHARVLAIGTCAVLLAACGENRRDVFTRGLEIENAAEQGPCKLHYTQNAQAAALSGDNVAECLRQTELAIVEYDKAAALGLANDPEFTTVYERAKVRRDRLASMLKHVRAMETAQMVDTR
jgi:hypothetical protein